MQSFLHNYSQTNKQTTNQPKPALKLGRACNSTKTNFLALVFPLLTLHTLSSLAAPTCNQLVCADVVKAQKIATDRLCVKGDAQFSGNVTIDGNLTVNGEINPVSSPFHGWWRRLTKANLDELYYINAQDPNNATIRFFGGDLANQYQYDNPDSQGPLPLRIVNNRVALLEFDNSRTRTVNTITGTFPRTTAISLTIQEGGEYDGLMFFADPQVTLNETNQLSGQGELDEKLNFNLAVGDQIRPWGNGDNAFPNSNSRRFMFEQVNQIVFENNTPALSPAGQAERLMERPERLALFDAIMNEGVEREPVKLYTINKTTKGSGTTTLFTLQEWPGVNFASTVRLSGLQGEWAVLNDIELRCAGLYNTDIESVEEQAPFFLADTRTYHILVVADTSTLPTFDPAIHAPQGATIHPAPVGPITEDIDYRPWVDAAIYYMQRVYQMTTHAGLVSYIQSNGFEYPDTIDSFLTKAPLTTWQEVSEAIVGNIPFTLTFGLLAEGVLFKSEAYSGTLIAPAYYLPYWPSLINIQINEPFEELGIPGSSDFPFFFPEYSVGTLPALGFNVPFENYVLPESRRWLYFRIQPDSPVTNEQQENVWVFGYAANGNLAPAQRGYASVGPNGLNTGGQLGGSRFEGLMSTTPWGDVSAEIVNGFWSPYTNYDLNDPQTFNAGIINPELVGGRKIGYINFVINLLHDPFDLSLNINFGNPALALSPDPEMRKRQQYDGEAAVISAMMKYFVEEQQVEAIIIDNRVNIGGFNSQSFLESFGGARQGGTSLIAFQNQDNRDAVNVDEEIDVYAGTREDNRTIRRLVDTTPWPTVRPDLQDERYPGSVFKNGPVILLDSQSAASGGDQISRYFMGNNFDGDLGEGVQAYVVGTIDGILYGYDSDNVAMIRSKYGSEFPDADGIGQSPVFVRGENEIYSEIGGAPSSTRLDPRTGFTEPIQALIPVNSNLTGPIYAPTNTGTPEIVQGALSTNIGDTVYFDFGYVGNGTAVDGTPYTAGHWNNPPTGIDQVDGFPGQPNPNDLSTLRDSWLEEAIRVIRLALGDPLTMSMMSRTKPNNRMNSSVAQKAIERFSIPGAIEEHVKLKQAFLHRANKP